MSSIVNSLFLKKSNSIPYLLILFFTLKNPTSSFPIGMRPAQPTHLGHIVKLLYKKKPGMMRLIQGVVKAVLV